MGERVPEIRLEFYGGIPGLTETFADVAEVIHRNLEDGLDIDLEVAPRDVGALVVGIFNDKRQQNMALQADSENPTRLDPNELLLGESIMSAGAGVGWTQTNYASCEYSELAEQQTSATSPEERQELVHEALSIASEDLCGINYLDYYTFDVYRTDQVEFDVELSPQMNTLTASNNPDLILNHTSADVITTNVNQDYVKGVNFWNIDNPQALILYSNLLYSPLVRYDRNYEIQNVLAEDYEIGDEFQRVTVTIRDHVDVNGDPITAEDVRWTYQYFQDHGGEPGATVRALSQPYDSIEVIDDRTVEFTFTEPNPAFETAHMPFWGIMPKDNWIDLGIEDTNHAELQIEPDELVTHGPMQINSISPDEFMELVPNDNHWNAPDFNYELVRYQDRQSAIRSFEQGDANLLSGIGPGFADTARNDMDTGAAKVNQIFTRNQIAAQMNFGPTKFREFRLAMSHCINRQELSEVVYYGFAEPVMHSCIFGKSHPFYPGEDQLTQIATDPTGDFDAARQVLEDAGWAWDDSGNLHYPPDADLEPLWPQGDNPQDHPDDFPCVEELEPLG